MRPSGRNRSLPSQYSSPGGSTSGDLSGVSLVISARLIYSFVMWLHVSILSALVVHGNSLPFC